MSTLSEMGELIQLKNEAILFAIEKIQRFRSADHSEGCESPEDQPDPSLRYHWRCCPDKIDSIIQKLKDALIRS
jgi:hypothetical protein